MCPRTVNAAAMSEFLVSLLGERLVNSEKAEVDVQSLGAKLSLVGLFFGCSLNAPCKQFNGSLCEFYSRFKKTSDHKDKLEIVFISSDQDQKHWQDFLQEMPWPALPFKDRHKKVRGLAVMRRNAKSLLSLLGVFFFCFVFLSGLGATGKPSADRPSLLPLPVHRCTCFLFGSRNWFPQSRLSLIFQYLGMITWIYSVLCDLWEKEKKVELLHGNSTTVGC